MKQTLLFLASIFMLHGTSLRANVYVVFYMTESGATGHVGIAVDNYKIVVSDKIVDGQRISREDTVCDNTLTFFDLWPQKDVRYGRFNKNTEPIYFRLPRTSAEPRITIESLLYNGLPHRDRRPCDGLIRIESKPKNDFELIAFIESLPDKRPYYNARKYNCADFTLLCVNRLLRTNIKAREFIPLSMVSTPNKLFLKLKKRPKQMIVLRDPGAKANGSFFVERVIKNKS